jgi:hypothetical protein
MKTRPASWVLTVPIISTPTQEMDQRGKTIRDVPVRDHPAGQVVNPKEDPKNGHRNKPPAHTPGRIINHERLFNTGGPYETHYLCIAASIFFDIAHRPRQRRILPIPFDTREYDRFYC